MHIDHGETVYQKYIKRIIDLIFSLCGIIILAPILILISVAILIDDFGPVLFVQKRVGKDKCYFKLHKFRSMKTSTPHDIPTHQLKNPEQYITRVGKFLRKYSLDELPQIYDILTSKMSIVGPRPALWNQKDLVVERDKYGANSVMPGLTGWAQINGRDELEILDKAKFDGEYVEKLKRSNLSGILIDIKCFCETIHNVLRHDGVIEGGTGVIHCKKNCNDKILNIDTQIGFGEPVKVDCTICKKVLITGADSYIGESFERYANKHYNTNFEIDTVDMIDNDWVKVDFSKYDAVFHVAGIAHVDYGSISEKAKSSYYEVNTNLAIKVAKKARNSGVKQFVFMSSMIIYGDSAPYGSEKIISAATPPKPSNFYGDSKWQADKGIRSLENDNFKVLVLRPPIIYGKGSKGNYPLLAKFAKKLPIFPAVKNQRSMLHIDNLCEFLCQVILVGKGGIFFPQNLEYVSTSDMVSKINNITKKRIVVTKLLKPVVWIGAKIPGEIGSLTNKAFGNFCYDKDISQYEGIHYQIVDFEESIIKTEGLF